jgi:hypothetical protein
VRLSLLYPAVLASLTLAGCALRDAPYRFRAPGVAGVQTGELARRGGETPVARARTYEAIDRPAAHEFGHVATRRHGGEVTTGNALADTLRAMVGLREHDATSVGFVMTALATLGASVDQDLRGAADGPALVAMAAARGATTTEHEPLLGDVVVFDRVVRDAPASGLGVVVSRAGDATVEFVYLARGVVRRGFMNLEYPSDKRDDDGRVRNTIIRQREGAGRKGQGDLTAQAFGTYIRLDALSE